MDGFAHVVDKLRRLCGTRGASIFHYQDDGFLLFGKAWQRWTRAISCSNTTKPDIQPWACPRATERD